jgi:hypothetical protein
VRLRRCAPQGQSPAEGQPLPEWEYIPEGWSYPTRGRDAEAVADAFARKWRGCLAAIEPPKPLRVHHETAELNRDELLAAAPPLAREFLLDARFSAAGAPEDPVDHRSFLFNR